MSGGQLLLAAPMRVEARLVASGARGAHVHRTGMGPRYAQRAAQRLVSLPGDALLVVGFCGALERHLQPGEIVVADRVYAASDEGHAAVSISCPDAHTIATALADGGLSVHTAPMVCVGRLALGQRREQLREAGAVAVDMESVWLAAGAAGRPFAVVRVVLDTPERELFRPRMLPVALRTGLMLRRTAGILQSVAREHGLHRLCSVGPLPAGGAQAAGASPAAGVTDYGGESEV